MRNELRRSARAFLLGEENRGLEVMFKLMNTARLGTAMQGPRHR